MRYVEGGAGLYPSSFVALVDPGTRPQPPSFQSQQPEDEPTFNYNKGARQEALVLGDLPLRIQLQVQEPKVSKAMVGTWTPKTM